MKKLQCISKEKKYKNLTIGKIYDGADEESGYKVKNDAGLITHYPKKCFKPVIESIEGVSIEYDEDDNSIIVSWKNLHKYLYIDSTSISCGIAYLSGVNEIINLVNELTRTEAEAIKAFNYIMNKIIEVSKEESNFAFILMSTDINSSTSSFIPYLDEMCTWSSEERTNPNTGNTIKLWVFNV